MEGEAAAPEIAEIRQPDSPVSTAATIGSDAGSTVPVVAAVAVAAAAATVGAATKAKSPVAKKPLPATTAKKTSTAAKPSSAPAAKPATKEPVKKAEPTTRYEMTNLSLELLFYSSSFNFAVGQQLNRKLLPMQRPNQPVRLNCHR